MLITRYAKIVLCLVLASFCLLVTFDNMTDYGTNYLFVQHVMSMDTTFPGNALMYRSITNPTALADRLCDDHRRRRRDRHPIPRRSHPPVPGARTRRRKSSTRPRSTRSRPACSAFLVWFFGFMVVAGEWFAMWQSTTWNGQEAAFRFYVAVLGVLIFVNQPDGELPGFVPPPWGPRAAAAPTNPRAQET